jgi:hypothetical protein
MSPIPTLTQWLPGEFDNRAQAQEQPIWFVHLRLWHRLLPIQIEGYPAFFAEQANALYLNNPYRQRVLVLKPTPDPEVCEAQYFAFKQPDRFKGAGANPALLTSLSLDDLERLPGCRLTVTHQNETYKAAPVPDTTCCFQYNGETRQVILGFEISADRFLSYDRGIDPSTKQAIWGAVMGAYEFQKIGS